MDRERISRAVLTLTLLAALGGGFGAWRYFRVPVELRFPIHEAWWQLIPYGLIVVIAGALLFKD